MEFEGDVVAEGELDEVEANFAGGARDAAMAVAEFDAIGAVLHDFDDGGLGLDVVAVGHEGEFNGAGLGDKEDCGWKAADNALSGSRRLGCTGVGIEDFLWAAAVGGLASVVGELLLKERLAATRKLQRKRHYAPFVFAVVVFVVLEAWHPGKTMENTIISLAFGALTLAYLRPDLLPLMLTSALSFTALYFFLFLCLLFFYPEFVQRYYNLPNLLGIYFLGVPIEELLFAATGGAVWSAAYEYVHGYIVRPQ